MYDPRYGVGATDMGNDPNSSGFSPGSPGILYQRYLLPCPVIARTFNICPVGIGIRSHPADPSVHAFADVSDGNNEKRFEQI